MKNNIVIYIALKLLTWQILALKLRAEILSANQNAGFPKV